MPGKVETKHEMLRAGYKFLANAKCKSCGASIEWWLTTNKKKIPYDPLPANEDATTTPHWATCPKADEHRTPKFPATASPKTKTLVLDVLVRELRELANAKLVVMILDDGAVASWRNGISGEDLRQDLITEANSIRTHLNEVQRG
jgi:hypothetical protein